MSHSDSGPLSLGWISPSILTEIGVQDRISVLIPASQIAWQAGNNYLSKPLFYAKWTKFDNAPLYLLSHVSVILSQKLLLFTTKSQKFLTTLPFLLSTFIPCHHLTLWNMFLLWINFLTFWSRWMPFRVHNGQSSACFINLKTLSVSWWSNFPPDRRCWYNKS